MQLPVQAPGVQVWVDGTAVDIDAGRVTLAEPTHASARKGGRCESGDECKVWLDKSAAAPHLAAVIGSIRHKGLRNYWAAGQTKGLNAEWRSKLRRILSALEAADRPEQMNYPGSYFHPLKGEWAGRYAVRLTGNFRVTFGWNDDGAADVDIEDYHR